VPVKPATLEVREPLGNRDLPLPVVAGGAGGDAAAGVAGGAPAVAVVLPGADGATAVFDHDGERWLVTGQGAGIRLDGRPFAGVRELQDGDVVALGQAQILFRSAPDTGRDASLEAIHLAGNDTIAPLSVEPVGPGEIEAGESLIRAAPRAAGDAAATGAAAAAPAAAGARRRVPWIAALLLLPFLGLVWALVSVQSVAIERFPPETRIDAPDALSWQVGDRLYLFPGRHGVVATAPGHATATREIVVGRGATMATERFTLEPLPGRLAIDTGGVEAEVFIDGAPVGKAPGEVEVAAGRRLLLLRAARHLDATQPVDVTGRGERQSVTVKLAPSWGLLDISTLPAGATVLIDGVDRGVTPLRVEVESGLRELVLASPGRRPWRTRVAVAAGETLPLGPVTLGAPEATVQLTSEPTGAEVSVGGVPRGRTPLSLALPGGVPHELLVTLPGHRAWSRRITPGAGERLPLVAGLDAVLVPVEVRGEPQGALLTIDGQARGRTPQSLKLTATTHRLEIRAEGFADQQMELALAEGEPRRVDYRLLPKGRDAALPARIESKVAGSLRLVPAGTFTQGSDRREQGRRPNETRRRVTLSRDVYFAVNEVTNAQFRAFRPQHQSGIVGQASLDLDRQPVTNVSWDDAVEYCNWLSQQDGLSPAYEKRDGRWVRVSAAANGYRLPTEAEWEYAARYVDGTRLNRFPWGDALPPPAGAANVAGTETQPGQGKDAARPRTADAVLPGHTDEHPVVAPVGAYAANPLGLRDLAGNVSEWTHDVYASFVDDKDAVDPQGPDTAGAHAIRGSNWRSATVPELRLAWRDVGEKPSQTIGFRVVRTP
jgi:formylglycine-generating enzyme required for sulfatase activity